MGQSSRLVRSQVLGTRDVEGGAESTASGHESVCRLGAAAVCLLAEAWNRTITSKEGKVACSHRFLGAGLIPVTDARLQPISIKGLT